MAKEYLILLLKVIDLNSFIISCNFNAIIDVVILFFCYLEFD